jgi:anti-sigma factor RsiW
VDRWRHRFLFSFGGVKVDCSEFLDRYSDYRDGLLSAPRRAAFRAHLAECAACARHDAAVARGVELLQRMREIQPSSDFGIRLRRRLQAPEGGVDWGSRSLAARESSAYPFLRP